MLLQMNDLLQVYFIPIEVICSYCLLSSNNTHFVGPFFQDVILGNDEFNKNIPSNSSLRTRTVVFEHTGL